MVENFYLINLNNQNNSFTSSDSTKTTISLIFQHNITLNNQFPLLTISYTTANQQEAVLPFVKDLSYFLSHFFFEINTIEKLSTVNHSLTYNIISFTTLLYFPFLFVCYFNTLVSQQSSLHSSLVTLIYLKKSIKDQKTKNVDVYFSTFSREIYISLKSIQFNFLGETE